MILSFFRKLIDSPKTQQVWDEALPDFQTVINSTTSKSREHSPFFLTFFRHPNFPFASLTSSRPSLSEASTVAARLNFSAQILAQAAEHAKQMHAAARSSLTNTYTRDDSQSELKCLFQLLTEQDLARS